MFPLKLAPENVRPCRLCSGVSATEAAHLELDGPGFGEVLEAQLLHSLGVEDDVDAARSQVDHEQRFTLACPHIRARQPHGDVRQV